MGKPIMTNDSIIEMPNLLAVLANIFESLRPLDNLPIKTDLHQDLGLDSIDFIRLQVAIEDHFDIRFDPVRDDLATAFETAGSLLHIINTLKHMESQ